MSGAPEAGAEVAARTGRGDAAIRIDEAWTHNLQGVSCTVPLRRLTVVTGVSGSGKSSLAFDTLYAEGQRRFVETLSTYARQFLDQMPKPPVRSVTGIPPAIALRQGMSGGSGRSTVATVTEVRDHLELLFARAGTVWCDRCAAEVEPSNPLRARQWVLREAAGERVLVAGLVLLGEASDPHGLLRQLVAEGHRRVFREGAVLELDTPAAADVIRDRELWVVMDRIRVDPDEGRLREALESAFRFGEGRAMVVRVEPGGGGGEPAVKVFDRRWACSGCGTLFHPPIPALFHVSSAIGRCANCDGAGRLHAPVEATVVPDSNLSIRDEAVRPLMHTELRAQSREFRSFCRKSNVSIDVPWRELSGETRRRLLYGEGRWEGIIPALIGAAERTYEVSTQAALLRLFQMGDCPVCGGSGLSAPARAVRVGGAQLGDVLKMRIADARRWLQGVELAPEVRRALDALWRGVDDRLSFLDEAGAGYLTLNRGSRTLSGGELHRVLLATSVGRKLTDTLYVLDEPTAGLHAEDTERLLRVVERLRDMGNSVVVVEHDPDVIARAEHVIELGPSGGDRGGRVVFEGDVPALRGSATETGAMLRERSQPALSAGPGSGGEWVTVQGAELHNLRSVRASFPVGALSVVTGVSGSGKSTLAVDVVHRVLLARSNATSPDLEVARVAVSAPRFSEVVLVDQYGIARSSRSCALTLSDAYTSIRELFGTSPGARRAGLGSQHFSFNAGEGRCPACEGAGTRTVEMQLLADIEIPCETCGGRRFRSHVLEVTVAGKSIADVFDMTVDEGLEFFREWPRIRGRLEPLQQVGLGYLRLGQTTSQVSGGEGQRLKLAAYLGRSSTALGLGGSLFVLDEPTVGLHHSDVKRLLGALRVLTGQRHTVIVVEHNLDFVAAADWVVDMGPGAGPDGGRVVYEGQVSGLVDAEGSATGRHLRRLLRGRA